jgi:GNAT superfamily N-acetyltransferase
LDELQSIVDVTPWLAPVFVFEAFEGRGAAAQLIEAVEDEARRRSHQYLHLITDHHQQFYKRRGWQTIDDARLAVGLDFSLMQKRVIDARPLWSLPSDQRIALAEQLAVWDHEEFAYFFTEQEMSLDKARKHFAGMLTKPDEADPFANVCWVVLDDDGQAIASISLLKEDGVRREVYLSRSPWIASLMVKKQYRKQGIVSTFNRDNGK